MKKRLMAKLLRTVKDIRLWLSKASECIKAGSVDLQKLIGMDDKESSEINNGEPPLKKPCLDSVQMNDTPTRRIKKRNVALLLGYSGTEYYGMQYNHGFKTVEQELITALVKAGYVPPEAKEELHLIHFQRAARTDKGVSAAKQIVSFKIAENYNIENINCYLPDDIKVFGIKRVTKTFNAKGHCFGRTYSYTLPTYALSPENFKDYPTDFRIKPQLIEKVNEILSKFVGTRCFHNFTSRKDGRDPSAKRYIVYFQADRPFIDGEEFITLKIRGQSFMLHQIRKMVGYTIALMKGYVPEDISKLVWNENEKFNIPLAPGLGLMLEDVHYDKYNTKFGNDGVHHALTWNEINEEVEAYKKNIIFSKIITKELTEKVMFNWLQFLPEHKFQLKNSEEIPSNADIKEDEKKEALKIEPIKLG